MKRICFITAVPGSAHSFLRDHMASLQNNYKVYYVSNESNEEKIIVAHDGYQCVKIQRGISLLKDVKALWDLYKYFKKEKFDSVHSVTPKAGLLTAIAGYMAGVPVRIHIFTGQVWANMKGPKRMLLKLMDKVVVLCGTHFLVDGESQRQYLINEGILSKECSLVLGNGSICGVNLERFAPTEEIRSSFREKLKIPTDAIVFAFMGRLNRDKGVYELLEAFNQLAGIDDKVYLLLIGNDEANVSDDFKGYTNIHAGENFLYYGTTSEPQHLLQAGDVFVLPSYREGFGSSVIEASALGLPVICSDTYGLMDAMVDGLTGVRCKVADVQSLYSAMKSFVDHPHLIKQYGMAGMHRVHKCFDGKMVTSCWVDYYKAIIGE